ncbi:MAG: hypothetical protein QOD98_2388 [Nocardioidaceae bacterium]|nr:hypothetical protein [Nocardioidaceae bacterium]
MTHPGQFVTRQMLPLMPIRAVSDYGAAMASSLYRVPNSLMLSGLFGVVVVQISRTES